MNKPKKPPKFKSLAEEKDFWQQQDSTEYLDWSKAKQAVFPSLKSSTSIFNENVACSRYKRSSRSR